MILKSIHTNMLYYSHVNEDNRVERDLFLSSNCDTAVCISGSAERIISLMDNQKCGAFHAVDVNREALFLLELKLLALKNLTVIEYLQFIGHHETRPIARKFWFDMMKEQLDEDCAKYWEGQMPLIEQGILLAGHFEKFLARIRPITNSFLGKKFQDIFLDNTNSFQSLKWNVLKRVFSWQWIYRAGGNKDGAFIGKGANTSHIPNALDQVIRNREAPSSFMTHLIFKGHLRDMRESDLPPSLQKNILEKIRIRLCSGDIMISYHHQDVLSYARTHSHKNSSVFYSLSDLLSFEDYSYLGELLAFLDNEEDIIVWRTFLKNREENQLLNPILSRLKEHSERESTRMYHVYSLENPFLV